MRQPDLFSQTATVLPSGMRYGPDFLSPAEERDLIHRLADLPFSPFDFRGYKGLRLVMTYGWRYDYASGRASQIDPVPDWLLPFRARAAGWADLSPESLEQALINQYRPGAPIGWHRDRPLFDDVLGVSLGSPCVLRFRRAVEGRWERLGVEIAPRSIYRLSGEARWMWEHSIAPAKSQRYSITFRNLAGRDPGSGTLTDSAR